ncbi:(d)CMP kinase [Sphaerisporangium sp. TRM90804]|uniref:(d)CMP kinase n=1 Tax=Sphaerisporangium sp. TRM90804 TaxID=3031113 RepID=UPI0024487EF8|nr:(d)CMP kinase [Sphaerisporangium sp. TRM90804]MDH2428859.1 (d)CMP kinase [Sphaerisporangium sp. TRM90804]
MIPEGLADAVIPEGLAGRLRARRARVIAVDGPSGSGKTTIGGALAAELGAPLIHMDDLYDGWDGLRAGADRLVEWIVRPLAEGRPARWRRYDWALSAYAEWHELSPPGALVVEGVGAGSAAAEPYTSFLIWADAPPGVRRARALRRDGDAYLPHWERWARQEDAYFAADRVRARADVVIDTGAWT